MAPRAGRAQSHALPGHLPRLLAFVTDALVIQILAVVASFVGGALAGLDLKRLEQIRLSGNKELILAHLGDLQTMAVITALAGLIPTLVYFLYFETREYRGTPGKFLFGVQVVTSRGEQLTGLEASKRLLLKYCPLFLPIPFSVLPYLSQHGGVVVVLLLLVVSLVALVVSVVNPFFVLLTEDRVGLHDKFAGTRVVTVRKLGIGETLAALIVPLVLLFLYLLCAVVLFGAGGAR